MHRFSKRLFITYFVCMIAFASNQSFGEGSHQNQSNSQTQNSASTCPALFQHQAAPLGSSQAKPLCQYAGQVVLVVNTATGCGYTPQLRGLESLHQTFSSKGFTVLGFPSNSFFQEAKEGEDIAEFCRLNYGVTFPMFEKNPVIGADAQPLFSALNAASEPPKWNFFKYLIGKDATVKAVFPSQVAPDSKEIISAIEAALAE